MARILVVEDDEPVRGFVKRALEMDGHDVVTANDGGEGLDIISAEDGRFDLLVSDIKMPVMDGIALALAVGREWPAMPILLMTGYADQRERAKHLEAMVKDVLIKPFTLVQLRDVVARVLGS